MKESKIANSSEFPIHTYLAALTPLLSAVIDCSVKIPPSKPEPHIERFASSFLATIEEQGALVPRTLDLEQGHSARLLGLLLTHHLRTPDHPIAWFNLAVVLRLVATSCPNDEEQLNNHRLALAANAGTKSLELHSDAIRTWTELGIILHLLGETDDALRVFEAALEIKPDDAALCFWKAFAFVTLGRQSEALESVRAARAHYTGRPVDPNIQDLFQDKSDAQVLTALVDRIQKSIRDTVDLPMADS